MNAEATGKLVDHVIATVDPKQYYQDQFPDMRWPGASEARVACCFHDDSTPSLHFNPKTGAWFCHGCEAKGNSIVSFHTERYSIARGDAAEFLFDKYIQPIVPEHFVEQSADKLLETPSILKYLLTTRRLKPSVIKEYRLGWTGTRVTLPIKNEFGLYTNVKMYDPLSKKHGTPKMMSYKEDKRPAVSFAEVSMLFPVASMNTARERGYVVLCEGELDALAMLSLGLPSVTVTNGVKSWAKQYNELFRGLKVFVAYDNDEDGMLYDQKVACSQLKSMAQVIKRVEIPKVVNGKKTKDVTDWITHDPMMREKKGWLDVLKKSKTLLLNPKSVTTEAKIVTVSLDQASRAEWFNKPIRVPALITGKDTAPYMLPKSYRVSCNHSCDECPLADKGKKYQDGHMATDDPQVLGMIDASKAQIDRMLLNKAGLPAKPQCKAKCDVLETFTVEQILLIPTLDSSATTGGQYVMRSSFYVGHGLHSNRAYEFDGVTLPDPKDQHTTHLFHHAKPAQDEVESFHLTDALKQQLKVFQPTRLNIMAHVMSIAEWQSRIVTKIKERPDVHVGIDLVFHSVAAFSFNGEFVKRGMLDVLVIGDTRCGKGYIAEGLVRYYGLGEVASGENCTFAGLVGGLQQVGKRWLVTWGLIPLNHRRLVTIDEASSLSTDEIGNMSRVRSEGVAEISKIVRESTQANTRLIWLSNPRSGRPIGSYNEGVQAVKELVGANEDISRFDFCLTVATDEVPSEVINAPADYDTSDTNKLPRGLCRALVLWAWSRTPEQIKFEPEATALIISKAIEFGHKYSPNIPLVQGENIRIKIAKISTALAARVFSTIDGETLIVKPEHVAAACQFMHNAYAKPSMAYDVFSDNAKSSQVVTDIKAVIRLFSQLGEERDTVISGLSQMAKISINNLADYLGDLGVARSFSSDLVKLGCLYRSDGDLYNKNPQFGKWVRNEAAKLKEKNATAHLNGSGRHRRAGTN